jgi:hypothetical protein
MMICEFGFVFDGFDDGVTIDRERPDKLSISALTPGYPAPTPRDALHLDRVA